MHVGTTLHGALHTRDALHSTAADCLAAHRGNHSLRLSVDPRADEAGPSPSVKTEDDGQTAAGQRRAAQKTLRPCAKMCRYLTFPRAPKHRRTPSTTCNTMCRYQTPLMMQPTNVAHADSPAFYCVISLSSPVCSCVSVCSLSHMDMGVATVPFSAIRVLLPRAFRVVLRRQALVALACW